MKKHLLLMIMLQFSLQLNAIDSFSLSPTQEVMSVKGCKELFRSLAVPYAQSDSQLDALVRLEKAIDSLIQDDDNRQLFSFFIEDLTTLMGSKKFKEAKQRITHFEKELLLLSRSEHSAHSFAPMMQDIRHIFFPTKKSFFTIPRTLTAASLVAMFALMYMGHRKLEALKKDPKPLQDLAASSLKKVVANADRSYFSYLISRFLKAKRPRSLGSTPESPSRTTPAKRFARPVGTRPLGEL